MILLGGPKEGRHICIYELLQLRARACRFILLRNGTDLEGAFDTASHAALDRAMKASKTKTKTRNVWRMVYRETSAMIRVTTAGGQAEYSREFRNERGGNQGTVLMPANFIILTHYVYLVADPARRQILGPYVPVRHVESLVVNTRGWFVYLHRYTFLSISYAGIAASLASTTSSHEYEYLDKVRGIYRRILVLQV